MNKPPIKSKVFGLPTPEGLRSERWKLGSTLSLAFFSRTDNVAIHLWPFISVAAENATNFMYICWVSSPEVRFTTAWGVNDQGLAVEGMVNHLRFMLPTPAKGEFVRAENNRIPWIRFATEIDPEALAATNPVVPAKPENEVRTVEDMLEFVEALGEGFDEPMSRAIAVLSVPTADDEEKRNHMRYCLLIGEHCREQEVEAVFWPTSLLEEALDNVDMFVETIIPPHYIPVGPELWYPERRIRLEFPLDDPRRQWELSGFEISCIFLLPYHSQGRDACLALFVLQTDMVKSDIRNPDDLVSRIIIAGVGEAGEPCYKFYNWIMAGIEFMKASFPGRTRHTYRQHEHKIAHQRGRKLQPYSIMEVRQWERSPSEHGNEEPESSSDDDPSKQSPYSFSFFQRRHLRRLNKPRKSDGLQVIRVATGQKCKHLPLKPGAKLKITKVVR